MITISVGNTPLFIPEDTALVLEQNNAALSDDGITADIVWTFEIPAEPNQRILGAVQYLWSSGNRRYDCELAVDGVPISRGSLYVQSSSDERTLQCGMVSNNFEVGFGEKMLRENDYGDDIIISESEENHKTGWRQFLLESLKAHSIYKFFLYTDSKFYSDNEDYGYYKDKISPLVNDDRDDRKYTFGYVNRLFWNYVNWSAWHISVSIPIPVEDGDSSSRGCRLFNTESSGKKNGYCFAPAIRLDWLVRKVLTSAGLSSKGTFFQSEDIKRLYSQSLNAMDGDVFQYGYKTWLHVGGNIVTYTDTIEHGRSFTVDADSDEHTSFGWVYKPTIDFKVAIQRSSTQRNKTGSSYTQTQNFIGTVADEVYAIAIGSADSVLPTVRCRCDSFPNQDGTSDYRYGRVPSITEITEELGLEQPVDVWSFSVFSNGGCYVMARISGVPQYVGRIQFCRSTKCNLVQITPSAGKGVDFYTEDGGYCNGSVSPRFMPVDSSSTPLFLRFVKLWIISAETTNDNTFVHIGGDPENATRRFTAQRYGDLEYLHGYEVIDSLIVDNSGGTLNIFSNILKWREHVPNLSNGEFLTKICKAFGLSMFVNPMTREVQLDFFRDVMKGAGFDISEWVTTKERQEYSPKKYTISFKQTIGKKEVAEKNIIDPVPDKHSLPHALVNKGKHAFVKNELANRRSSREESTLNFRWEQAGGDTRLLTAGAPDATEEEALEIDVQVPNMTYADELSTAVDKYMCQIEAEGCSPMLDEDYNGEFDMVLQQYRGSRYIENIGYIEDANPTIYNQEGDEEANAINLSAVGKRSIGEMWLKPLYDMKGDCDRYRVVAHLPSWAFLQVMSTLQPQDGSIYEQKRWILCDGVRMMPLRISTELSGRDTVICTIEGVAPHTDNSGAYPYVEEADRFLLGDQNDYVLADENDYALEIEV